MEAALVHLIINTVIGSFIGAIALWIAVKLVQKVSVPYWSAYMAVLLAGIVNILIGLAVGLALGAVTRSQTALYVLMPFMLSAGFLVQAGFVSSRLNIRFSRACLVTLVMVGIILVIAAILFAPLFFMSHVFEN